MKNSFSQINIRVWYSVFFLGVGLYAPVPVFFVVLVGGAFLIPRWWEVLCISFFFDILFASSIQNITSEYLLFGIAAFCLSSIIPRITRIHKEKNPEYIRV